MKAQTAEIEEGPVAFERFGVVARILTGPHDANRQDSHLPMRYDTCGWRIGKNSRVVRCARRPEPESSAKTAFVRCTIEAVPSVSQGGRAIGVERWRVLSNQIFSRFRRQAAIGV